MKPPPRRRLPGLSLRTKLLALSLALLVIPWTGYRYVTEMERFLRSNQEQALFTTARSVARVLGEQPQLLPSAPPLEARAPHLYIRALPTPLQLDGYSEDWSPYLAHSRTYTEHRDLDEASAQRADVLAVRRIVGTRDGYVYALFEVRDDHIVYQRPGDTEPARCDHLRLMLETPGGERREYLFATPAPGWVSVQHVSGTRTAPEAGIRAEWQETADGYVLEMRIPVALVGPRLGFTVADVDDPVERHIRAQAGTDPRAPETVTLASPAMQALLSGAQRDAGRIWVVDPAGRVLASVGDLRTGAELSPGQPRRSVGAGALHLVYGLILDRPADAFQDDLDDVSRLDGREVRQALAGVPAARSRTTPDGEAAIVSVAQPVLRDGRVRAAVVVEQTSHRILLLQNRALEHLFNYSLIVFVAAAALLTLLATRLAGRVRRLRDEAEQAVSADGRVVGTITPVSTADELGDLSRSFAALVERLGQYTRYLETMAGKLSHELRTPLTVVRSSLDNLEASDVGPEARLYSQRAREGLARLEDILNRMSEATRLEQALQRSERERFDLAELVRGCVAGYRLAYPGQSFELAAPPGALPVNGVPELIAQMLDKLVSNAVDFARPDTPVGIALEGGGERVLLRVRNEGPPLPAAMKHNLFDSMVSLRPGKGREPHLGLGLYIVRLVAEFHHGRVRAEDRTSPPGVEFTVDLPLSRNDERG